jgi:hypothetical protein
MSVNISNGANITDTVDFKLTSIVGWDCIWFATVIPCHQPTQIIIAPGELGWPKYTITVPEVVDGVPLAFVRHDFQLTATSSIDGAQIPYNFTLEPDEFYQAEFDSPSINITLDPGNKERRTFTARNSGNSPASLVARVVPLANDGQPINGFPPDLSFQHNGWLVGLFNYHNLNGLGGNGMAANAQATIDVEVQPPSLTTGEIRIGIILWSANNPSDTKLIEINSSIQWQRNGSLSIDDNCDDNDVMPDASCLVEISITNLGNFEDAFELTVDSTEWLTPILSRATTVVAKGETQETATLILIVNGMVPAFSHGQATITLKLNNGEILGSETVEMRVAPLVAWELNAVESSTDALDNVSVAFTMRNLGNGDDGLQVTLHVDMNVEHGFIPPEQAQHGSTVGAPRYFEIEQIPPSVNLTFRAWMHIPRDTDANGTITMTVEMQSTLIPTTVFSNVTQANYLAEEWRPENIPEETFWLDIEIAAAEFWNEYNGLFLTILVVLAGALGLLQALKHREAKDTAWRAKLAAAEPPLPEKPEDWMLKFSHNAAAAPKAVVGAVIEAPKMAAKVFTDIFASKSPPKREEKVKPSEELLDAANTVLVHHETTKEGDLLDDLASSLVVEKASHPANDLFPEVEADSGRTVRKPKRAARQIKDANSKKAVKKDIPQKEDEFDLDL